MKTLYDDIGINYTNNRRTDDRIAAQLHSHLKGAKRIINIGAGTGSYEPENANLVALEPSSEMIAQRKPDAYPTVQAFAELLPFENKTFSHAMSSSRCTIGKIKQLPSQRLIGWFPIGL